MINSASFDLDVVSNPQGNESPMFWARSLILRDEGGGVEGYSGSLI